jgi:membrane-associated phospholipid phosphatase
MGTVQRRAVDAWALAVSLAVGAVAILVLGRIDRVPEAELRVFHAINDLPSSWNTVVHPLMYLGTLFAVPIAMVACLVARKYRMTLVVGLAGLGAYALARAGKQLIGRGRPGDIFHDLHIRDVDATGLGFPSGHAAVAAALVVAALPYLVGRWRWALLVIPPFMAFARVYVGAHLPLDVVSGAAIGTATASALHLALGVPIVLADDPALTAPVVPSDEAPAAPPTS